MPESYTMSPGQLAITNRQVVEVNSKMKKPDGSMKGDLGKDSFLKLLVAELRHQDPTQPMDDKQFISQMAQFSALEQMKNISASMEKLNSIAKSNEAFSILGKRVDALDTKTGKPVNGTVDSIFYKDNEVRLMVNKTEIGLADIHAVYNSDKKQEKAFTGIINSTDEK